MQTSIQYEMEWDFVFLLLPTMDAAWFAGSINFQLVFPYASYALKRFIYTKCLQVVAHNFDSALTESH